MNSINLMPKVPFAARFFIPLSLLIILVIAGAGIGLYHYSSIIQTTAEQRKAEETESQKQIQSLQTDTQVDPMMKETSVLMTEFTRLKDTRRDWVPVFNAIVSAMPAASRMTQATEQTGVLSLTVQFVSLQEAAEYTLRLGKNPIFKEVKLQKAAAKSIGANGIAISGLYEAEISVKLK